MDANARTPRVLVVEDYPDTAVSLCVLLDLWGYEARHCGTGGEARATFATYQPHALLLDIHLPDADGVELAKEFLAHDPPPVLAIVSGTATAKDRQRVAAAGVTAFFAKPAEPDMLRRFLAFRLHAPTHQPEEGTGTGGD